MNAPLPDDIRKALESVTLDDKYALESGRAFMSGVQALVRLPMLQRALDQASGLSTAGYISGYPGRHSRAMTCSCVRQGPRSRTRGCTSSPASTRTWR